GPRTRAEELADARKTIREHLAESLKGEDRAAKLAALDLVDEYRDAVAGSQGILLDGVRNPDPDSDVRRRVAEVYVLLQHPPAVDPDKVPDYAPRMPERLLAFAVRERGEAEKKLFSREKPDRLSAIQTLYDLGSFARPAAPALRRLMASE